MSQLPAKNPRDHNDSKTFLGFWTYIMTDCVLFATLFATYAVLHTNTYGGPTGKDLFSLPFVLTETLILLASSFACGIAIISARNNQRSHTLIWLIITAVLGLAFLTMEITEFSHLVKDGHDWQASAFLSSFFTLVGTHGLHILAGLIWAVVLVLQIIKKGLNKHVVRRLTLFSLFWHFLDVVWIFIFTVVYLMGAI